MIPTRDRWGFLRTTLRSALSQTGVDHEVVVVDDGSRDETSARLAELGDMRLRVVRHDAPTGQARARNDGIAAARGEWIAFLDDDDLWSPEKLALQRDAAESADAVFAYSHAVVLDEDKQMVETLDCPDPADVARLLVPGNAIPAGASNVMARTDVVRKLGGFDERLSQFSDWDLWLRIAQAGSAAACQQPLVAYIQHPDSILVKTDTRELIAEFDLMIAKHTAFAQRVGLEPSRPGLARWIAWGTSRAGRRFRAAAYYFRASVMSAREGDRWMARRSLKDAAGALRGVRLTDSGRQRGTFSAGIEPGWLALYR